MTLGKHSLRLLSASAIGCAFLLAGSQMGCEPVGDGTAPREPAPREPAPPPAPQPRDPYDDPTDPTPPPPPPPDDPDPYDPGPGS